MVRPSASRKGWLTHVRGTGGPGRAVDTSCPAATDGPLFRRIAGPVRPPVVGCVSITSTRTGAGVERVAKGLTEANLRALAGTRSFERGTGYLDAVSGIEVGDDGATATVHGTERYEVELTLDGPRGLSGECDCPYGLEGNFCKHLVALGLSLLARSASLPKQRRAARDRARTLDAWLSDLSREELLELVRDRIAEDRAFRRRLELRVASSRGDLAWARSRIRELLDIGPFAQYGYVEYAAARAYADQAGQAASAIRELTGSGRAADAIPLAQEAIRLLAGAAENVDDSDGWLGQVGAALADAHHDACRAADLDPEELAHWLVEHALHDDGDFTDIDPLDYEDVLGEQGMTALRRHAVEAWRSNRTGWAEKYLMERLAKAGGDADMVIAVHAADLAPDGSTHLTIARELDTAGRPAEALEWAERGIRDSEEAADLDAALVDYLADRYTQADRLADAVALRRDHFDAHRTLPAYQQLRAAAQAADGWPPERERALALLRADAERRPGSHSVSVLVDALLDDKDTDAAWQAATETGAHDHQWRTLADHARPARPADALAVYLRLAEPLTRQTGNALYERLVGLLLNMRDCHRRLNTPDEFTAYVTDLRTAHRRKRNLMRLMDEHGL
ncbi:SWIM zinc finger domain-containing protein [Streptomyces sp. NPDC057545]|uniref:SWIM zinc finger family protein n=1 Tax=Streptomyces sp. NPDC057545 TaxID=3346164 RepID=UPI0036C0DC7C